MRGRSIMVLAALVPAALFVGKVYWAFPGLQRGG